MDYKKYYRNVLNEKMTANREMNIYEEIFTKAVSLKSFILCDLDSLVSQSSFKERVILQNKIIWAQRDRVNNQKR